MNDQPSVAAIISAQTAPDKPAPWGEVNHTLLFPVSIDGLPTVERLTLREPNGEMLEQIDDLGFVEGKDPSLKQAIGLIRILAGQPKAVTDKMHARDIAAVSEAMAPLLDGVL